MASGQKRFAGQLLKWQQHDFMNRLSSPRHRSRLRHTNCFEAESSPQFDQPERARAFRKMLPDPFYQRVHHAQPEVDPCRNQPDIGE